MGQSMLPKGYPHGKKKVTYPRWVTSVSKKKTTFVAEKVSLPRWVTLVPKEKTLMAAEK